MQNIIATMSFDELDTKSSIKIKGHIYNKIPGMHLYCNRFGNIVQYNKSGIITTKPIYKNQYGYEFIKYGDKNYFVHRLIALAYGIIDDYYSELEIDHINDIRNDNRACNLQALTKQDNLAKRKKTNNKKFKLSKDNEEHIFNSKTECAQWLIDNGYSISTLDIVKAVLARKGRLTHYGFEYEEIK